MAIFSLRPAMGRAEALEPAKDPHTRHKSLDDLAGNIQRAICDLLRARTQHSDAVLAVAEAQSNYDAAVTAFTARLEEMDLLDKPQLECPKSEPSP